MISKTKTNTVPLVFEYNGKPYKGMGIAVSDSCREGVCFELNIFLNDENLGTIYSENGDWVVPAIKDRGFINTIGQQILLWYE